MKGRRFCTQGQFNRKKFSLSEHGMENTQVFKIINGHFYSRSIKNNHPYYLANISKTFCQFQFINKIIYGKQDKDKQI